MQLFLKAKKLLWILWVDDLVGASDELDSWEDLSSKDVPRCHVVVASDIVLINVQLFHQIPHS